MRLVRRGGLVLLALFLLGTGGVACAEAQVPVGGLCTAVGYMTLPVAGLCLPAGQAGQTARAPQGMKRPAKVRKPA